MSEHPQFTRITSEVVPLARANVDTDQILPARFLKRSRDEGLGPLVFHDLRFDDDARPRPDFPLNDLRYGGAQILVAGENFGSGSSREAAVYALYDFGFRCVIAPSFGSIFFENATRNGLVPVQLSAPDVASIADAAGRRGGLVMTVDLERSVAVLPSGDTLAFAIPSVQRIGLLNGRDEIEMTIGRSPEIRRFSAAYEGAHPWINPAPPADASSTGPLVGRPAS